MPATKRSNTPSIEEWMAEVPLYESIDYKDSAALQRVLEGLTGELALNLYCPACGKPSTFRSELVRAQSHLIGHLCQNGGAFWRWLICSQHPADRHEGFFFFWVAGNTVRKIGQWPSLPDFAGKSKAPKPARKRKPQPQRKPKPKPKPKQKAKSKPRPKARAKTRR
jgi:hypothetical protein